MRLPMVVGGLLFALGTICLASLDGHYAVYFPRPPALLRLAWNGSAFVSEEMSVSALGVITRTVRTALPDPALVPHGGAGSVTIALGAASLAACLAAVLPRPARSGMCLLVAQIAALLCFQATAAQRLSVWAAPLPLVLAACAMCVYAARTSFPVRLTRG
jgi:hypothetical protein